MLRASNMFGVVVSVIFLSTLTDVQSLYAQHHQIHGSVVHKETSNNCSEGYTYLMGKYYKLHTDYVLWNDAKSGCSSEGAHLVVLNDAHEAEIVTDFALTNSAHFYIFIGLHKVNNNWQSVLGDSLDQIYYKWIFGNYLCGVLRPDGLLEDMNCEYFLPYVCEKQC